MPKPPLWIPLIVGALILAAPANAAESSALIEDISGAESGPNVMDYVSPGQTIGLGDDGTLVVSYFDTCKTETITGGTVTIGRGASSVDGGKVDTVEAACQGSGIVVSQSTQDAAGTVHRVKAFKGEDWDERTIKSDRPVFSWANKGTSAALVIHDLDENPPAVVWRGSSDENSISYPADAPPLDVGVPYRVKLILGDSDPIYTVFSIDPGLEGPDSVLGRLVPIRPQRAKTAQ